mmetsp:Transcript_107000/g.341481  ORF Transcript_107000/g.341481 Transcript_107000/m.341481 type:complete len:92 (+) Transcript_107000:61-336(+)
MIFESCCVSGRSPALASGLSYRSVGSCLVMDNCETVSSPCDRTCLEAAQLVGSPREGAVSREAGWPWERSFGLMVCDELRLCSPRGLWRAP